MSAVGVPLTLLSATVRSAVSAPPPSETCAATSYTPPPSQGDNKDSSKLQMDSLKSVVYAFGFVPPGFQINN